MMRRLAGAAAAAAILGAGLPAAAETLVFGFEGAVTTLTRDGGLFGSPGTVQIGNPFTGRFSYEVGPGNPDQEPGDPEAGRYVLAAFVVDQSVISFSTLVGVAVAHQPGLATLPPAPPDPGRDWLRATATSEVYPTVSVRLQGPFGSAFTDDSLPTSLDLADFPDVTDVQGLVAVGIFPNPSIQDIGSITAMWLVPEPDALVLGAVAIATLALRRQPRRA